MGGRTQRIVMWFGVIEYMSMEGLVFADQRGCSQKGVLVSMPTLLHGDITEKIIGASFDVHNSLGKGLAEKTYENALFLKLQKLGLKVEQQKCLPVVFEGQTIGEHDQPTPGRRAARLLAGRGTARPSSV